MACHCRMAFARSDLCWARLSDARSLAAASAPQTDSCCTGAGLMFAVAFHLVEIGAAIVAGMMLILWVIHLLLRNAAIVDVGWAAGLTILAIYYAIAGPGYPARKYAIATMAGIWGLRLAT